MSFASSALVVTTKAKAMSIADFIMAILKIMRFEKVADALPFTICGLCEEGGKQDDGSKFFLRPVLRVFSSEIRVVVTKNCRRKRIPSSPLFKKHVEYSPH